MVNEKRFACCDHLVALSKALKGASSVVDMMDRLLVCEDEEE
jgi:hypothetical protein